MGKVFTGASMSIDGYIAGPRESGFEHLFKWYGNGDVEMPTANPKMTFRLTEQSAAYLRDYVESVGVLVVGRRLWDLTDAWGGRHPLGVPCVVLTHHVPEGWEQEGEDFVFVTEGIEAAIAKAKEIAGEKVVGLNGGSIASQALDAGLVDEIFVDLVPVLLGGGVPFFEHLKKAPVVLEGPVSVIEGKDVTHLRYVVRR
jgi:dihydrofolate reductase